MIDLVRARRVRHDLDRLTEITGADRDLDMRTRAWLAEQATEDTMAQEVSVTLRLAPELLDRAERLVSKLEGQGPLAATRVSRSTVIRLAMLRGLDAIERELKTGKKGR